MASTLRQVQRHAGGGVGVGDGDEAVQGQVVGGIDAEILPQRDGPAVDAVQVGVYRVEAVADVREIGPGRAEGHEGEVQDVVGAVGHEHGLPLHAVARRQRVPQVGAHRVGVQLQLPCLFPHRLDDAGSRGIGALVGVQLDVLHVPGLFAGGVDLQGPVLIGEVFAH